LATLFRQVCRGNILTLPGIGGIEAIKQLKQDPLVAEIPVVVLSAWTSQRNREDSEEAGAAKFLAKPVDTKRLIEEINDLIESDGSA